MRQMTNKGGTEHAIPLTSTRDLWYHTPSSAPFFVFRHVTDTAKPKKGIFMVSILLLFSEVESGRM